MHRSRPVIISAFVDCHLMQECILQLKPGKAVSFDGSRCLNVHFCLLFNALLRHGVVPSDFCSGVIIPLLKGNLTCTGASAASKLFELILLKL